MQPKLLKLLLRILQVRPNLCHVVILMTGLTLTLKVGVVFDRLVDSYKNAEFGDSLTIASAYASSETEPIANKTAEEDKSSTEDVTNFDPLALDENQVRVLKALAEKKEIESDNELEKQKSLIELSEKKINQQLNHLEKIKDELKSKQDLLTSEEKENVQKMAKIYEAMKPEQAAPIFNKMDTFVLAQIVKAMNQKKSSQIIAIMEPAKAQSLTIEMLRVQPVSMQQKM